MENIIRYWSTDTTTKEKTINGLGLVWFNGTDGTKHQIGPETYEGLAKDANIVHHRDDVLSCFNHDFSKLLGRESNGTLRIQPMSTGVSYQVDLNESDPEHQSIKAKIDRHDITGSSAVFKPLAHKWDDNVMLYTDIMLVEIGVVSVPAMLDSVAFSDGVSDYTRRAIETRKRLKYFLT